MQCLKWKSEDKKCAGVINLERVDRFESKGAATVFIMGQNEFTLNAQIGNVIKSMAANLEVIVPSKKPKED